MVKSLLIITDKKAKTTKETSTIISLLQLGAYKELKR